MNDKNIGDVTETATAIPGGPAPASPQPVDASGPLPLVEVPIEYYVLEGEQGRGGIGIVMRARDRRTDRVVALKQLQSLAPEARLRFEREMRITARLEHPGVVPVHETGRFASGEPFYAMKLVQGRSLKEVIAEKKTLNERLALIPHVLAVAETIAYAHSQRVIHRDLKPSNVIVGAYGETVVIDWGLAKDLDAPSEDQTMAGPYRRTADDEDLTAVGQVLGTPAYMAPEQAKGDEVDARADIYAIGAILYHLLAGVPPYRGSTSADVLGAVLQGPPIPIGDRDKAIAVDLAAIVEKSMSRDVGRRYANAGELVADLRRFQTGQLVSAYSYAPRALLARWLRRHRTLVTVLAIAGTLMLVGAAISVTQIVRAKTTADEQRSHAEARAADLASANDRIESKNVALMLANATAVMAHDPASALKILAGVPVDRAPPKAVRDIALRASAAGLPEHIWKTVGFPVMALSSDESRLAILDRAGVRIVEVASHATVGKVLWNDIKGTSLPDWETDDPILIQWDGDAVVAVMRWGRVGVYRAGVLHLLAHPCHEISAGVYQQRTHQLYLGCVSGEVVKASPLDSVPATIIAHHVGRVAALAAPSEGGVVSLGEDRTLRVLNRDGGENACQLQTVGRPNQIVLGKKRGVGYVGTRNGEVLSVDLGAKQHCAFSTIFNAGSRVTALMETSTEDLAVASEKGIATIVDPTGRTKLVLAHGWDVIFSPDWAVASDPSGAVTFHCLRTGWERTIQAHDARIQMMVLAASGQLFTSGEDGSLRQWPRELLPSHIVLQPSEIFRARRGTSSDSNVVVSRTNGEAASYDRNGGLIATRFVHTGTRIFVEGLRSSYVAVDIDSGDIQYLDAKLETTRLASLGARVVAMGSGFDRLVAATAADVVTISDEGIKKVPIPIKSGDIVAKLEVISPKRLAVLMSSGRTLICDENVDCEEVGKPNGVEPAGLWTLGVSTTLKLSKYGSVDLLSGGRSYHLFSCGGTIFRLARTPEHAFAPCLDGVIDLGARVSYVDFVGRPYNVFADGNLIASAVGDWVQFRRLDDHSSALLVPGTRVDGIVLFPNESRAVLMGSQTALYFWDLASVDWVPDDASEFRTWLLEKVAAYEN